MPFNLTTEPWIPVVTVNSNTHLVSLADLFTHAHEYVGISSELPTEECAILRLAVAILHRALPTPTTTDEWADLWDQPTLPVDRISAYLNTWAHRFDLLHPSEPFMTVADQEPTNPATFDFDLSWIVPDHATRRFEGLTHASFAEAARLVLTAHAFDVAGIKRPAVGTNITIKGGKSYPRGLAFVGSLGATWLTGANLRETLLLNLIIDAEPRADDLPAWERPQADVTVISDRDHQYIPTGPVDVLTLQSRRIRLYQDPTGSFITAAHVAYGERLDFVDKHKVEPMAAWRRSDDGHYRPIRRSTVNQLWQGAQSLLAYADDATLPPASIRQLATLALEGILPAEFTPSATVIAVQMADKDTKYQDISRDTMHLPARVAQNPYLTTDAITATERATQAIRAYTDAVISLRETAGWSATGKPLTAARDAVRQTAAATIAPLFDSWLGDVTEEQDDRLDQWGQTVAATLRRLWALEVATVPATVRAGRLVKDSTGKTLRRSYASIDVIFQAALRRTLALPTPTTPTATTED